LFGWLAVVGCIAMKQSHGATSERSKIANDVLLRLPAANPMTSAELDGVCLSICPILMFVYTDSNIF